MTTIDLNSLRKVGDQFHNALTLVDRLADDQPLVYVNQAFEELTGYAVSEILGRNCRFLQGPDTDRADTAEVRQAIQHDLAVYSDLLNYRKDGRPFFNRLVLLPLQLGGRPHFIGMQIDATPLLAPALSRGRTFRDLKASEAIRDRINTPLMKIWTALAVEDRPELCATIMAGAFEQILETVRALPFRP